MDDLGSHDLGPYGNRIIDTPNINRFAEESARFTNAYAACPVCSPTRASIMTGQYPARLHLTDYIPGRKRWPYWKVLTPEFHQFLPMENKTIPEAIAGRGYRTAAIGKWHLGGEGRLPTDRGFGLNVGGGYAGHPPGYFGPVEFPGLKLAPGEFLTQRLTDEGIRFMGADKGTPFFSLRGTLHGAHAAPGTRREDCQVPGARHGRGESGVLRDGVERRRFDGATPAGAGRIGAGGEYDRDFIFR